MRPFVAFMVMAAVLIMRMALPARCLPATRVWPGQCLAHGILPLETAHCSNCHALLDGFKPMAAAECEGFDHKFNSYGSGCLEIGARLKPGMENRTQNPTAYTCHSRCLVEAGNECQRDYEGEKTYKCVCDPGV